MIRKIDLEDERQVRQLLDLQIAAYTIEAELIGSYEIPPLKDTVATVQASNETFYGYFIESDLGGIISYKIIEDTLDIHRLAVSPAYFRRGIARQLFRFVQASESGYNRIIVSTGSENRPAINFYLQLGFTISGEKEVIPGLVITLFEQKRQ